MNSNEQFSIFEEALIEHRALLSSFMDLSVDQTPPLLFVLDKSLDRLTAAFDSFSKSSAS